ncbi:hypothetical protein [Nonomuraea rhizosphaerae]|uniref:hypothetical protein n=1 Tax=Nonomuraea rhizosphaerae TaxID=2665663 RepID=UPI001C605E65|nr:hypothetical protein [Nonomuraea rhizosphaerae]
MEDDRRVWPPSSPSARHRRTSPEPAEEDDEPPVAAPRRGNPYASNTPQVSNGPQAGNDPRAGNGAQAGNSSQGSNGRRGDRRGPSWHGRGQVEEEPEDLWNPQIRRTAERGLEPDDGDPQVPWESLPPSARFYGAPADPGLPGRVRSRKWRRPAAAVLALLLATGLVAGLVSVVLRMAEPEPVTARLSDSLAGVTITLPQGWREAAVPPVTGFTSVVRGDGALVMARPVPGPVADVVRATRDSAELYSRLLLKGDKVEVVEDKEIAQGHTRALRAQYADVVNRPAFLRVTLLSRDGKAVLLVGLLQPEEAGRRQALDAVMSSVR